MIEMLQVRTGFVRETPCEKKEPDPVEPSENFTIHPLHPWLTHSFHFRMGVLNHDDVQEPKGPGTRWMSKASGRFKKVRFLTRPTPARQDAPFPRARPQAAKEDEAYMLSTSRRASPLRVFRAMRTPLAAFFNRPRMNLEGS